MITSISDDLFRREAIANTYTFIARLREDGPVHSTIPYSPDTSGSKAPTLPCVLDGVGISMASPSDLTPFPSASPVQAWPGRGRKLCLRDTPIFPRKDRQRDSHPQNRRPLLCTPLFPHPAK
jgi:hypothetical protein